jgi:toxin ParE1/3/4
MRAILVRAVAENEIDEIAARIAKDKLSAALRFYQRIEETFERLAVWPSCGAPRVTRNPLLHGLRSYPIRGFRNYLVFYIPFEDRVEILHVVHGARNLPAVLNL